MLLSTVPPVDCKPQAVHSGGEVPQLGLARSDRFVRFLSGLVVEQTDYKCSLSIRLTSPALTLHSKSTC